MESIVKKIDVIAEELSEERPELALALDLINDKIQVECLNHMPNIKRFSE